MKIKEVCKRTGLTERTIRFYVEENLISPQTDLKNGREYRDYSKQDVAELITIADLRRLFFSISEIKEMKESPERITEIVDAYKTKLNADAKAKASIVQALDHMSLSSLHDVKSLAESLKSVSEILPLPSRDITPNFGRFDSETKEDREREYELFKQRQARNFKLGRFIVFSIAAIHIVFTLISAFIDFRFFSLIIQVALAIALFAGVTWVRYLFVGGAVINLFINFVVFSIAFDSGVPGGFILLFVLHTIFAAAASVLLLSSNIVHDFLYSQKHG